MPTGGPPTSATWSRACGSPTATARCARCRPTGSSSATTPAGCSAPAKCVLWAAFRVRPGCAPEALRAVARESLAFRKRTQPLASPSAGCIFQNPQPGRDVVPDGIPPSAGALVDRAGLKDQRRRRRPRLADPRQLHRQRRPRHRRRHRGAGRSLPRRGPRALRRHAARGDCPPRRLVVAGSTSLIATMSTLVIEGGHRLSGVVDVEGNKNAALPLMAATLLTARAVHAAPTCRASPTSR